MVGACAAVHCSRRMCSQAGAADLATVPPDLLPCCAGTCTVASAGITISSEREAAGIKCEHCCLQGASLGTAQQSLLLAWLSGSAGNACTGRLSVSNRRPACTGAPPCLRSFLPHLSIGTRHHGLQHQHRWLRLLLSEAVHVAGGQGCSRCAAHVLPVQPGPAAAAAAAAAVRPPAGARSFTATDQHAAPRP